MCASEKIQLRVPFKEEIPMTLIKNMQKEYRIVFINLIKTKRKKENTSLPFPNFVNLAKNIGK